MPLSIPKPPDSATTAAENGLRRVLAHSQNYELQEKKVGDRLDLSMPHQVYTLGLLDLVRGATLDDARALGWRYLISGARAATATSTAVAEVLQSETGNRFTSYDKGWLGRATELAASKAQSLPAVAERDFELRMLRVPAAKIDVLWLKSGEQDSDLVVPIASANPIIDVNEVYTGGDFLSAARRVAEQELRDGETSEGTPVMTQ